MTLIIRLLGDAELYQDETPIVLPGYRPLALLTYLLLTKKAHSRTHLVDLLFDGPADPRAALRWTLSKVRQTVGPEYILAERQRIGFNFDADFWCDVEALAAGEMDVYRGDLLQGLPLRQAPAFAEWLLYAQQQMRHVVQTALLTQLKAAEKRMDFPAMAQAAHQLLQLDNLREEWHLGLMRAYVGTDRRAAALAQYALCRQLLRDELSAEPGAEMESLYLAIMGDANSLAQHALSPLSSPGADSRSSEMLRQAEGSLERVQPLQLTPFVGRSADLRAAQILLADEKCRLLTLVGLGGVGKSRLALQLAAQMANRFSHGAYFAPLATVESMVELAPAIAKSLGLTFHRKPDQIEQLFTYLRGKSLILVLDNFEQLLAAPDWQEGELLLTLLTAAPQIKLVITSRQRLHLPAEWLYDVEGLAYPLPDRPPGKEELMTFDSVQLFIQRAQQVNPEYAPARLENANLLQIGAICRSVAGMPLAIELLAAWTRYMTCTEISHTLASSLEILTAPAQAKQERQSDIHTIFDHSWQLLTRREQQFLAQLTAFRSSFTRQAAARVTGASLLDLSALIDKSFLTLGQDGRYDLHPLIHRLAAAKLAEKEDVAHRVRDGHSLFYCHFLFEQTLALRGAEQISAAKEIGAEIDNIRYAWRWLIQCEELEKLAQTIFALGYFYYQQGRFRQGHIHFQEVLAQVSAAPSSVWQLLVQARIRYWLGHYTPKGTGTGVWDEILALLDTIPESTVETAPDRAAALYRWGLSQGTEANWIPTKRRLDQSLAIFRRTGDEWYQARVLLAYASHQTYYHGKAAEAQKVATQALTLQQKLGDLSGMVETLELLCIIATFLEQHQDALRLSQQSLDVCHQLGRAYQTGTAHQTAGWALLQVGRIDECLAHLEESRAIFEDLGADADRVGIIMSLAWRNSLIHNHDTAVQYAHSLLNQPGAEIPPNGQGVALYTLAQVAFSRGEYLEARAKAQESLNLLNASGSRNQFAIARYVLAAAQLALDNAAEACSICLTLLKLGSFSAIFGLSLAAILLGRQAQTKQQAAACFELIGLQPLHLPMLATPFYVDCIQRLLPDTMASLSEDERQTAMARGRTLQAKEVTIELILKLSKLATGQSI